MGSVLTPPRRIVLVGMMGTGKTTIGRLIAGALGWPYHDNDDLVHQLYAATPRELLANRGEVAMREAEARALALALEAPWPCVISAGGGTILNAENRRLMREAGTVVWLRASAATLEERAVGAEHRPWIDGGARDWIRAAVADRDPLYASVADLTVETDGRILEEVRREVVEKVSDRDGE